MSRVFTFYFKHKKDKRKHTQFRFAFLTAKMHIRELKNLTYALHFYTSEHINNKKKTTQAKCFATIYAENELTNNLRLIKRKYS